MIVVQNLSKSFGDKKVLDHISFEIRTGECLFVLGKSGVGKSVLLKHIVGLVAPDEGSVTVAGLKVDSSDPEGLLEIRKRCGLVFQFPALLDSATVFENVSFGLRARGISTEINELEAKVKEQLLWVGLSDSVIQMYPTQLSYSSQKRVSIARTLAVSPDYFLFDEPTTGMDPVTTTGLNLLIKKLTTDLGATTVVVSHDIKSALEIADRIILLDEGKIVFDGSSEKFRAATVRLAREFQAGLDDEQ